MLIWPVAVQGEKCAPDVARAIAGFNALTPGGALPRPDLLIVARGGGSVEDLWGFNEEVVARAAAASEIPLISAVGHETDTTLIDFVSDKRAPTPTAAAELAVPVRRDLLAWLDQQGARLSGRVGQGLDRRAQRLRDLARALPRAESLLDAPRQRLDARGAQLGPALLGGVNRRKVRLADVSGSLRASTLQRMVRGARDGFDRQGGRLAPLLTAQVARARERYAGRAARFDPQSLERDVSGRGQMLHNLVQRFVAAGARNVETQRARLEAMDRLRETLSYKATLARGFAVVRSGETVVATKAAAEGAEALSIEFQDGRLDLGAAPATTRPTAPKAKSKPKPKTPEQGSLF